MATERMTNKHDDLMETLKAIYDQTENPQVKELITEAGYMTDDLYYEATSLIEELQSELAAATYTPDSDWWSDMADGYEDKSA